MPVSIFIRRVVFGLLGSAVALSLMAAVSRANEVPVDYAGATALTIHDADETLQQFCRFEGGKLFLVLPNGMRFELVTSTDDPAISNPGDGAFHPFAAAEVKAAMDEVRYPMNGVAADIFILPYPRRSGVESAAGPQLVLLSPGVRPLSREQQHAETVHELGHVVQYAHMPDSDDQGWERYRRLRGIENAAAYSTSSAHRDRPHEIFAEDFRALFGGTEANYAGTIENPDLAYPSQVTGLSSFMLSITRGSLIAADQLAVTASPNPSRDAVRFARSAGAVALDLFDVSGRRLRSLEPVAVANGAIWNWDGRDAAGRRIKGAVVFARPREPHSTTTRVTLLP